MRFDSGNMMANLNPDELKSDLTAVANGVFNEPVLQSLTAITISPAISREFVEALLARQPSLGACPEDAVYETERILENLADRSIRPALILMKRLQHYASELYMHDVYHSVELWIWNSSEDDLR